MLRGIIEIYVINRIIPSTSLSPYSVHPSPVPDQVHPPGDKLVLGIILFITQISIVTPQMPSNPTNNIIIVKCNFCLYL